MIQWRALSKPQASHFHYLEIHTPPIHPCHNKLTLIIFHTHSNTWTLLLLKRGTIDIAFEYNMLPRVEEILSTKKYILLGIQEYLESFQHHGIE